MAVTAPAGDPRDRRHAGLRDPCLNGTEKLSRPGLALDDRRIHRQMKRHSEQVGRDDRGATVDLAGERRRIPRRGTSGPVKASRTIRLDP